MGQSFSNPKALPGTFLPQQSAYQRFFFTAMMTGGNLPELISNYFQKPFALWKEERLKLQ